MSTPAPARSSLAWAVTAGALAWLVLDPLVDPGPISSARQLLRWLAAALACFSLPTLLQRAERGSAGVPAWRRRLSELGFSAQLPALIVLAAFAWLTFPWWLGEPPVSRDHGSHYFQTQIFVEQLREHGRLRGPSMALNHGYPFGDSYPVLGYAWTAAAHLVSGGAISLRASYAMGVAGVWAIYMSAAYALGRRAGRELGLGGLEREQYARWAGAFAALVVAFDPGDARQGGWDYAGFHGVWPQLFSTALFLASLELGWRALQGPSLRRISSFALAWAASIVAHPFGLITGALALVAWPMAWAVARRRGAVPPGSWRALWIAAAASVAMAAGSTLIFLHSAGAMARVPVPWTELRELAADTLTGEAFGVSQGGARALAGALGLVGLIGALRRGSATHWMLALLLGASLLLGSTAAITVLRLDLSVSGFENLQYPRYAFVARAVWAIFAGIGGAVLLLAVDRVLALRRRRTVNQRLPWPRALASLLAAPFVAALIAAPETLWSAPVGVTHELRGTPHAEHEAELRAALDKERQRYADEHAEAGESAPPPIRVAFLRYGLGDATYPLFTLADLGLPFVLDAHIPAVNYKYRLRGHHPAALRAMGVTHVLYSERLSAEDQRLADQIETRWRGGEWTLARLRHAESRATPWVHPRTPNARLRLDPLPLNASAEAGWVVTSDRHTGALEVDLAVGPYRNWTLVDSQERAVRLRPSRIAPGLVGTRFELPGPGRYELRWVRAPLERRATQLSWFALGITLVGLAFGRRFRPVSIGAWFRPFAASPGARIAAVALLLASLSLLRLRQDLALERSWWRPWMDAHPTENDTAGRPKLPRLVDVVDAGELRVEASLERRCDRLDARDAQHGCHEAPEGGEVSFTLRGRTLHRCLEVWIPARGTRVLAVDDAGAGTPWVAFANSYGEVWLRSPEAELRAQPGDGGLLFGDDAAVSLRLHNAGNTPATACVAMARARE